jgi:endonuclease YncB( thermonuclease family)
MRKRRRRRSWNAALPAGLAAVLLIGGLAGRNSDRPEASHAAASAGDRFSCTVTKIHDGDGPIWCAEGPKVRLTAIAARELDETCQPGHPCPDASGASALAELTRLAAGQVLSCEQSGTSYHRVTAWCWRPDGRELNCAMVKSGKALHWRKFDPDRRLCGA